MKKMKLFKILLLAITLGSLVSSCDLTEEPTFLSEESAYSNLPNIQSSLTGIYSGVAQYNYYSNDFIYSSYCSSGFFISGLGNTNQHIDNKTLASLKPLNSATYTENPWKAFYKTIERANKLIANVKTYEFPETSEQMNINDAVGEAYFLRAFTYFNLVRMFGSVPLRLEPSTSENLNMPKSSTDVIYQQIIDDAKKAEILMFPKPMNRPGYPAAEAASMLLAKVYMTMATTDDLVPISGDECWALAYDEAKKVYGKYSLNSNYGDLFTDGKSNHTEESIFEINFNDVVHTNIGRLTTANHSGKAKTWGRVRINAEIVDQFLSHYPTDTTRYNQTFISKWIQYNTVKVVKTYPTQPNRNGFASSFPYLYKYWVKNRHATTPYIQRDYVVYRYADLLLMLAEISNELQNGEQFGYVNEVLARVGLSTDDFVPDSLGADYNGGKEGFRKAIMMEYRFELLGEGHDYFNNRRRGYDFFKEMVIDPHNNWEKFNPDVDVTLSDDKDKIMHFPIPLSEINTNNYIDN